MCKIRTVVFVLFTVSVFSSLAMSKDFVGGHHGNLWHVDVNWSPFGAPTIADDVVLEAWPYQGPVIDATVEAFCRRLDGPAAGSGGAQIMLITGGSLTIGAAANDYWRIPMEYGQGPAEVVISGGDISVFDYMFIGRRAEAVVTMSGGTLSTGRGGLDIGRDRADATSFGHGTLNLSGGTINTGTYFGLGNSGQAYLNMTGGAINVSSFIRSAYGNANAYCEVVMDGGTIHVGEYIRVGESGAAEWIMNDGELNVVQFLRMGHNAGSSGYFELNGGTVTIGRAGRPDDFEIRYGSMNITGGTLVIRSNAVEQVENYFNTGLLLAYGGHGTLYVEYNEDLVQTIVTAEGSYYQAGLISPRGVIDPRGVELQWLPGVEATECVLYFGQDYELVSSGDASVYVDTFPVGVTRYVVGDLDLDTHYYWRVDSAHPGHPDSPWIGAVFAFKTQCYNEDDVTLHLAADMNYDGRVDIHDLEFFVDRWLSAEGDEPLPYRGRSMLHPAHPFWPAPHLTLITGHDMHRSRGGSGLIMLEDKWIFSWRRSSGHRLYADDVIKMAESRDGGRTLENIRVIYDEGVGIDSHRTRLMGNGRIGIFGTRRDNLNVSRGLIPYFITSDDEGQTWTSVNVSHLPEQWNPGFTFIEYPASVGGHDTEGYMLFMNGNDGYMYAGYTIDNGQIWQSKRLFPSTGGEVSVVRLGDTERWVMTCRADNNPVYKTTDLFNWDGPYDSGKQIGSNSSTIVYHNGHVTWIAASRPFHYESDDRRAIPVNGEVFQGIVTCTVDAEAVWNDPAAWPDWSILMYLPVHLDPNVVHHQGHWYMLFGAVEGPSTANNAGLLTYSRLGIMSSVQAGTFYPGFLPDRTVQGDN